MRYVSPILLLSLFYACGNESGVSYTYETQHVSVPSQETVSKVSELVSSIEYVKLNDSIPESHFSQLDKLIITDDRLYTFEIRGNNRVLAFDKSGNFLHTIGRKGRGPGEYLQLLNFTVTNDNTPLLLDNQGMRMFYYDADGNYQRTKEMPFAAKDVVALRNGNLMFMLLKGGSRNTRGWDNKKVVITDKNFNLVETKLTYADDELNDYMWMSNFSQADDEIIFAHPICDTVYVMDSADGAIKHAYYMDFAGRKVPFEMRDSYMEIFEAGRYSYLNSVPVAVGDYLVGKMSAGGESMTYALNRKTKEMFVDRYFLGDDYNLKSVNIPLAQNDGAIATVMYYSLIREGAFEKNNLPKDIGEFIASGGYVVCLMPL